MNPKAMIVAAALCAAAPALAHVTLEQQEAIAGSYYKAVVRVPHGCEGAPTLTVRVAIPDGVLDVKPMPKPGWQLATVIGKLAEPFKDSHGTLVSEGVREVTWSGGRLDDKHYDEFVLRVKLPAAPGVTIAWPVVQECEGGKFARWIEIPAAGQSAHDLRMPAAFLKLNPR